MIKLSTKVAIKLIDFSETLPIILTGLETNISNIPLMLNSSHTRAMGLYLW